MKKRDLVLDFTSLLDVILIILFIVISSLGQTSFNVQEEMQKQNEDLQKQVEELLKENNLYKTENIDKELLYESLMEESKKITLICNSYINPDKSASNEVEITIYSGESGGEQEALDIVTFTHNLNLTRDERIAKNAEMQADMYWALEKLIQGNDFERFFITIEYTYGDKNFSQTDLNNIIRAVDDLERNYSINCYIDKVKK